MIYNSDKYNYLDGRIKAGSSVDIAKANSDEIQKVINEGGYWQISQAGTYYVYDNFTNNASAYLTLAPGVSLLPISGSAISTLSVYQMGASIALSPKILRIDPSGDATGVTDTAAIHAAVTALNSTGGTIQLTYGTYYIGATTIKGGYSWLSNNYYGGIKIRGISWTDTVVTAVGATGGFIIDNSTISGAASRIDFEDFRFVGPGKATVGSIGFDYSDQISAQNAVSFCRMDRIVMDGFETCELLVDVTGLYHHNVYYKNYDTAIRLGYNSDLCFWIECQFGENNTPLGSQTEVSFSYDGASPSRPTNSGNQVIVRERCWFMRQAIVDEVNNNGTPAALRFQNCYLESCQRYGIYGTSGTGTSAPKNILWDNCHFSLVYEAAETDPKFEFLNSANDTVFHMLNCETDSSTGPNGGWITCGSAFGGVITIEDCRTITAGATEAWLVKYGNKLIPHYNYRGTFRFSGADNTPDVTILRGNSLTQAVKQVRAVTPADAITYQDWGAWTASSSTSVAISGDGLAVINNKYASTTDAAMLSGWVKTKQAASGSKPTAEASLRGCTFLVQGGAGVADILQMCMKGTADTYSWVTIATAP